MRTPAAVLAYMREYEETETEVREYILRQLGYYETLPERFGVDPARWVALKLGCTTAAAATAVRWAQGDKR